MSRQRIESGIEDPTGALNGCERPRRPVTLPKPPRSRLRKRAIRPDLYVEQILKWADAHVARTGRWPNENAGRIPETADDTWARIDHALRRGDRGLPRKTALSLPRLLEKFRGFRNKQNLPRLSVRKIITWAKAHYQRTGRWPHAESGPISDVPGEKWSSVESALRDGRRGLRGRSSLAKLLASHCSARNQASIPNLSYSTILTWCDAHKQRTGSWPSKTSGEIRDAPNETWLAIDGALREGRRGIVGGTSLALFLAEHRGALNRRSQPDHTESRILKWCDAHKRRTGRWPQAHSGPIADALGETWGAVDAALHAGARGLPGGSSLACLLAERRGVRNQSRLPKLSIAKILRWSDAYRRRTGRWPSKGSGPIPNAPGETWAKVNSALVDGLRGLPGGESLSRLLARKRPVANRGRPARRNID